MSAHLRHGPKILLSLLVRPLACSRQCETFLKVLAWSADAI